MCLHAGKFVVTCSNVKRSFLDGPRIVKVLRGVTLALAKGEMVCIMGPSGSGKTTLLNIIACLDKPTSGEVYIGGVATNLQNDDELSEIRRHSIGMIFQDFYLLPTLSTLENVEVPMIFDGVTEVKREKRAAELLALVGLSDRAFHRPGELSSGEKQKVAIARALANDPLLVLADEPTGNLDTIHGSKIAELLRSIAECGRAVLMVTHDPHAASQAHRVLLLRNGVIAKKSPRR